MHPRQNAPFFENEVRDYASRIKEAPGYFNVRLYI